MHARIAPAQPPFSSTVQAWLERVMPPGIPPLALFTTLARDERLFGRFFAGGLLDKGHLSLRHRELVIHRVTALCGSEYEWGVHAALFAERVGFSDDQVHSLVHGNGSDRCWDESERQLLNLCVGLQDSCTVTGDQWDQLRAVFSEEAILELLMLAGYYRTVSYLTNVLQLPNEEFARCFPSERAPIERSTADAG